MMNKNKVVSMVALFFHSKSPVLEREAHAPSVGKYGETNALEQPPQDRKHIL